MALQILHTRLGLLTIWCVYCDAHLLLVLTRHLSLQCLRPSPLVLLQDHFMSLPAHACTPRPPRAIPTTVCPSLFGASRIRHFLVWSPQRRTLTIFQALQLPVMRMTQTDEQGMMRTQMVMPLWQQ
ncbi:hypothetical protein BGW80DRAFT_1308435 [Lactifluus volemus]|nr:hypothetical protein BGW80DRAFT_1308435 [Lactifluus volemus]